MPFAGEPPGHDEFARRRGERRPSSLSQAGTPLAESRSADGSPQQPGSGSAESARAPGMCMETSITANLTFYTVIHLSWFVCKQR